MFKMWSCGDADTSEVTRCPLAFLCWVRWRGLRRSWAASVPTGPVSQGAITVCFLFNPVFPAKTVGVSHAFRRGLCGHPFHVSKNWYHYTLLHSLLHPQTGCSALPRMAAVWAIGPAPLWNISQSLFQLPGSPCSEGFEAGPYSTVLWRKSRVSLIP